LGRQSGRGIEKFTRVHQKVLIGRQKLFSFTCYTVSLAAVFMPQQRRFLNSLEYIKTFTLFLFPQIAKIILKMQIRFCISVLYLQALPYA